jgi:hypothetical protein
LSTKSGGGVIQTLIQIRRRHATKKWTAEITRRRLESEGVSNYHHGVSAKHLQAYLNEFTFRFNRRFYPFNAFRSLLGIAGGEAAPTFDELYSGELVHPTFTSCG